MPYTPPALSPGATPHTSRSSSFSHDHRPTSPAAAAALQLLKSSSGTNPPRSATHKHRRTPSMTTQAYSPSEHHAMGREAASRSHQPRDPRASGSVHRSPPPTDNVAVIPPQAVLSPPDSTQNSSDEEAPMPRRGRDLGRLEEQLKEAIKSIPQRRHPSPDPESKQLATLQPAVQLEESRPERPQVRQQRSYSESDTYYDESISDTEDDAFRIPPPMIRKKSGELVKSSLKSPSRSRPVSVPSTPTFPKNVHFDSHIEQVRHFLHSEKPSAVSAGSSPVESHNDYEEFPFGDDHRTLPYEWELVLPNFPKDMNSRKHLPIRLEKACLSTDKKNLIGTVAVMNIAFQKFVVARFTFDYWQTVSEVSGEYSNDVRRREMEDGCDRFVFKIKLAEQANLENKTLFFCVKYIAAGQEHWDNNAGVNFQVDFKKKPKPQGGKNAVPRSTALPRSSKPSAQAAAARPRSMTNFENFENFDPSFFARAQELAPGIPRKASKAKPVEEDTALPARRANPPGNAFGNRYDFGASLTAAIKAASACMGPEMGRPAPKPEPKAPASESSYFDLAANLMKTDKERKTKTDTVPTYTPQDSPSKTGAGPPEVYKPDNVFGKNPSIESPSYRELLDNYCFVRSTV